MEFRTVLENLFNQLSDTDRRALHFSLGNQIPHQYRDNCTPSGSLLLLDYLFDQNLITEENFDYLIDIFEKINCCNASTQLKNYKFYSRRTSIAEPVWTIENDKMLTCSNDLRSQSSQLTPSSSELEGSRIPSSTITSFDDIGTLDEDKKERLSSTIRKICSQKHPVFPNIPNTITILSTIFCLILLCFILFRRSEVRYLPSSLAIEQELYYVMNEGLEYGSTNVLQNEPLNDGKDLELTYADRCIGVELRWTSNSLISIRFLYSNNRSSSVSIAQSNNVSSISSEFLSSFMLTSNEEINKINFYQNPSETNFSIFGIQFRTTKGRKSDVFGSNDGHFLTESFEFYTFGYVKQSEMLQFVWIKKALAKEPIITVPLSMVEICEFTFTSAVSLRYIDAKGIESSWYDLKRKFDLQGAECNSLASYYEKISQEGPQLFAIVNNTFVFYHDQDQWYNYHSAQNITCAIIPSSQVNSTQKL